MLCGHKPEEGLEEFQFSSFLSAFTRSIVNYKVKSRALIPSFESLSLAFLASSLTLFGGIIFTQTTSSNHFILAPPVCRSTTAAPSNSLPSAATAVAAYPVLPPSVSTSEQCTSSHNPTDIHPLGTTTSVWNPHSYFPTLFHLFIDKERKRGDVARRCLVVWNHARSRLQFDQPGHFFNRGATHKSF